MRSTEQNADAKPEESPVLNDDARKKIEALPGVEEVAPEMRAMADVEYGDKTNFTLVGRTPTVRHAMEDAVEKVDKAGFSAPPMPMKFCYSVDFAKKLETNPESVLGKTLIVRYAERQNGDSTSSFSIERKEKQFRVVGLLDDRAVRRHAYDQTAPASFCPSRPPRP